MKPDSDKHVICIQRSGSVKLIEHLSECFWDKSPATVSADMCTVAHTHSYAVKPLLNN